MKLNIETFYNIQIDSKTIAKAVKQHFSSTRQTERQDLEIDVHFPDKSQMIELNKTYRDKDYLTDVLSFSYMDDLLEHENLAGEMFISLEKAEQQAKEKGNDLRAEIFYLIAHGYLHITGYLHDTDQQEATMNKQEDAILKTCNTKINR